MKNEPQMSSAQERDLSRKVANEYKNEILEHISTVDHATRPDPSMIEMQPEIEWHMWSGLVDFLVNIVSKLRLEQQTLFLALNIVNRYCSRRIVFRKHFQLVGCTALWIASKYEDKKSRVPTLAMLSHMCCKAYQEEMFVQMEGHILNTLDWTISQCTVDSFLSISLGSSASPLLTHLAAFLSEQTLYHAEFVGVDPCLIARNIHVLALHILSFYPTLQLHTCTPEDAWCLETLGAAIKRPSSALTEKYSTIERFQVARLVTSYLTREQHAKEAAAVSQLKMGSSQNVGMPPLTPPQYFDAYSSSSGSSVFTPPLLSNESTSSLCSRIVNQDSPLMAVSADLGISSSPPVTPLDLPKRLAF